jgi:hypothetical protein
MYAQLDIITSWNKVIIVIIENDNTEIPDTTHEKANVT